MSEAKLEKIWINSFADLNELIIDWSNDRHQRIIIKDNNPDGVIRSLHDAIELLMREKAEGHLNET